MKLPDWFPTQPIEWVILAFIAAIILALIYGH